MRVRCEADWSGSGVLDGGDGVDQAAETGWLGPFKDQISQMWDITNVHINKNSMKGVQDDIVRYPTSGPPHSGRRCVFLAGWLTGVGSWGAGPLL